MARKLRIRVSLRGRETGEAAIDRIGRHMIEVWRAAEEIGNPEVLDVLRPAVIKIGQIIAADLANTCNKGSYSH